jgi:hypothetical protein
MSGQHPTQPTRFRTLRRSLAWWQRLAAQAADAEALAISEELVPLRAIGPEAVRKIVEAFPELSDLNHLLPDHGARAALGGY